MCGIAGAYGADGGAEALVARLNALQCHRGPDNSGLAALSSWTLGNTRLAIQDPTPAGNQPVQSWDGTCLLVLNGEIYNFRELARSLALPTEKVSDSRVLVELWARRGAACLGALRGMFAIAVIDGRTGLLTLARDPFGIKPLYWGRNAEGRVVFASEARPLARCIENQRVCDAAVRSFLRRGGLLGDESPFEAVSAVAANTAVTFERSGAVLSDAAIQPAPWRSAAGAEPPSDLPGALQDSVDVHLRSDVPTALLLSGGVDSSAIAATAAELGHRLHCLTVAGGPGTTDEVATATETAKRYGHDHEVVPATLDGAAVDAFFAAMQRPSADGLNTFLVCRAVRSAGFKVALSGLGGDEALGGYSHFRLLRRLAPLRVLDRVMPGAVVDHAARRLPAVGGRNKEKLARMLRRGGPRSGWDLGLLQREFFATDQVAVLTGHGHEGDPSFSGPAGAGDYEMLVEAEVRLYMQSVLLPDADAFSMASSVELRVPFVDTVLFPQAARMTGQAGHYQGKLALARALGDGWLEELARRRKRGFSVPVLGWMSHGPLARHLAQARRPDAPVWGHIDRGVAASLLGLDQEGGLTTRTWAIVALNQWLESLGTDDVVLPGPHRA